MFKKRNRLSLIFQKDEPDEVVHFDIAEVMFNIDALKRFTNFGLFVTFAAELVLDVGHVAHAEKVAVDFDVLNARVLDVHPDVDDADGETFRMFDVRFRRLAVVPFPVLVPLFGDLVDLFPIGFGQTILRHVFRIHVENGTQQFGAEFLDRHFPVHQVADVGDAAADGFGAFGFEFFRIGVQGSLDVIQVQVEHERAVAEHPAPGGELGVAGNFLLSDLQVVAAAEFGIHPHAAQRVDPAAG